MILLDTSAWIWWVGDPTHLSSKARRTIASEEGRHGVVVSAISVWEIGIKVALGKLVLDREVRAWVALASSYPGLSVHPIDPSDALESTLLPGKLHKDPADRILIAVSRRLHAPLVTADGAIRRYPHVETVW